MTPPFLLRLFPPHQICYTAPSSPNNCTLVGPLAYWESYTDYVSSVGGSDAQLLADLSASNYPSGAEATTRALFSDDLTYSDDGEMVKANAVKHMWLFDTVSCGVVEMWGWGWGSRC